MTDLVTITDSDEPLEAQAAALGAGDAGAADEEDSGLPAGAKVNADGTITLSLTWPAAIKYKSADGSVREEPIEELVFHRLRGGDLRALMNSAGKDASLLLFNRSLRKGDGRGPLIFDTLDAVDAQAALRVIGFLSGLGGRTGR